MGNSLEQYWSVIGSHVLNIIVFSRHQSASKVSKTIGILYKSSLFLPKSSLHNLYYSLVCPCIHYCTCILVCGSTYPTNLHRLSLLQKQVIRVINKDPFDDHTGPIFKKLNLLKIEQIYLSQLGHFMFLYENGSLPECFISMKHSGSDPFSYRKQVHGYNMRNAILIIFPSVEPTSDNF